MFMQVHTCSMQYTINRLRKLHAEFHSLVKYEDRVAYYDQHFQVIALEFPPFQPDLRLFFSDDNLFRLHEILNYERNNKPFIKCFTTDGERFRFSITPLQHQVIIFNKYMSAKYMYDEEKMILDRALPEEEQLKIANDMVDLIEQKIKLGRGLDFSIQFMSLFLKGVKDAVLQQQSMMIYKKRKVIELYLYATGFSFGRYLQRLKQCESAPVMAPKPLDAVKKLLLLDELGCIEAIRKKYASLGEAEIDRKIAEVLSLITGDNNWLKISGLIGHVLLNKHGS